jgi:hypothetical protein
VAHVGRSQPIAEACPAKRPMAGPGCFSWNAGGWFGGQAGSTAWLLMGAVAIAPQAPGVAAVWLGCFAAANVAGFALWRRRDRIRPFPGIMAGLLAYGSAGLVALLVLGAASPKFRSTDVGGVRWWEPSMSISTLVLLDLGLAAFFSFQEWGARRARLRGVAGPGMGEGIAPRGGGVETRSRRA